MKKTIIMIFIQSLVYGTDYYLNFSLPVRQTEVSYRDIYEKTGLNTGFTIGLEVARQKKEFEYGFGFSSSNPIVYKGLLYQGSFLVIPAYIWGNYNFTKKRFYLKSKFGTSVNYKVNYSNLSLFDNKASSFGLFLGLGLGYRINEVLKIEFLYEVIEFKTNENKMSFEDFKIFKEGAIDVLSLYVVYKI